MKYSYFQKRFFASSYLASVRGLESLPLATQPQDIYFIVSFEECQIASENSALNSCPPHSQHLIFSKSFYHTDACTSRNFLVLLSTGGYSILVRLKCSSLILIYFQNSDMPKPKHQRLLMHYWLFKQYKV